MKPYTSTKQALADAADLGKRLGFPAKRATATCPACHGDEILAPSCKRCHGAGSIEQERVQHAPGAEPELRPIAVRAVLTSIGIDPDGEDAQMLYMWATTSDDARWEALAEGTDADAKAFQAKLRRLDGLASSAAQALREHEVVVSSKPLQLHPVAYRVHENGEGRRELAVVVDPHPGDDSLYRGPKGWANAMRVVNGAEGPVVHTLDPGPEVKHLELRNAIEDERAAQPGRWAQLAELDEEIAGRLGCSVRHARRVRRSWGEGYHGARGRSPTPTPAPER